MMRSHSTNGRAFPQARDPRRVGAESMAIVDRRQPTPSRSPWRSIRRRFARLYYADVDWMILVSSLFWIGSVALMSWVCWELALWLGAEHWTW